MIYEFVGGKTKNHLRLPDQLLFYAYYDSNMNIELLTHPMLALEMQQKQSKALFEFVCATCWFGSPSVPKNVFMCLCVCVVLKMCKMWSNRRWFRSIVFKFFQLYTVFIEKICPVHCSHSSCKNPFGFFGAAQIDSSSLQIPSTYSLIQMIVYICWRSLFSAVKGNQRRLKWKWQIVSCRKCLRSNIVVVIVLKFRSEISIVQIADCLFTMFIIQSGWSSNVSTRRIIIISQRRSENIQRFITCILFNKVGVPISLPTTISI